MAKSQLVLNGTTFSVGTRLLVLNCNLFESNPGLLGAPYLLRSRVSTSSFQLFLSALDGESITISESNQSDLTDLCDEFGYSGLSDQLAAFIATHPPVAAVDTDRVEQQGALDLLRSEVSSLRSTVVSVEEENRRLRADLSALSGRCEALHERYALLLPLVRGRLS
jgi:hypothetical protein